MFKFRGKKWRDMSLYERAVFMDILHKWLLPVRIIIFPIMFIIKVYKWTYDKE